MNNIKANISCKETKTGKIMNRIIRCLLWIAAIICIIIGFESDYDFNKYYESKEIYWYEFSIMYKSKWYDEPDCNTTSLHGGDIIMTILNICIIMALPLLCDFICKFLFNVYQKYICKNSCLSVNGESVEGVYLLLGILKKVLFSQ